MTYTCFQTQRINGYLLLCYLIQQFKCVSVKVVTHCTAIRLWCNVTLNRRFGPTLEAIFSVMVEKVTGTVYFTTVLWVLLNTIPVTFLVIMLNMVFNMGPKCLFKLTTLGHSLIAQQWVSFNRVDASCENLRHRFQRFSKFIYRSYVKKVNGCTMKWQM